MYASAYTCTYEYAILLAIILAHVTVCCERVTRCCAAELHRATLRTIACILLILQYSNTASRALPLHLDRACIILHVYLLSVFSSFQMPMLTLSAAPFWWALVSALLLGGRALVGATCDLTNCENKPLWQCSLSTCSGSLYVLLLD